MVRDCEVCGGPIYKREGTREMDYLRLKTCSKICNAARLTTKQLIRDKRNKQVNALKRSRIANGWGDIQRFISGYQPLT